MKQREVSQIDFLAWKKDPVTKFISEYLKSVSEFHKEELTNRSLIGSANGQLRLNYLRGYLDAIEDFLNIEPNLDNEGADESKGDW